MSSSLSRKQIQQMRRLSNARFPMLGVVVVAALFVVRVPIIQSWESRADARNLQQDKNISKAAPGKPESPEVNQVAASESDTSSQVEAATAGESTAESTIFTTSKFVELLTRFQAREQSDGFPQNDTGPLPGDASTADPVRVEDLDDLDVRHVSQLGSATDEPELTISDERVLKLHNPAENGGIVYFVVGEGTFSIDVGQTLELSGKDQWLVMFHRGGEFGNSRATLKPGAYTFSVTQGGWRLRRATRIE